jgi:probable phosphoglycerate mutase
VALGRRLFSCNHLEHISELQNVFCALRHGRSLANEAGIISSHPDVATVQHGLSKVGEKQAKDAGVALIKLYKSAIDSLRGIAILSSDYLRAKETALYVAKAVVDADLPLFDDGVILETRLRERCFGEWDGGADENYAKVWKNDAVDPGHNLHGVESVNSVMERTTQCVLDWDAKLKDHVILLVAHGDVLQITQTAFAKLDGSRHRTIQHLETATMRPLELAS